jgi:hypothetical protein
MLVGGRGFEPPAPCFAQQDETQTHRGLLRSRFKGRVRMLVGERGFEPPAPASRKRFPCHYTAVFRASRFTASAYVRVPLRPVPAPGFIVNFRPLSFWAATAPVKPALRCAFPSALSLRAFRGLPCLPAGKTLPAYPVEMETLGEMG